MSIVMTAGLVALIVLYLSAHRYGRQKGAKMRYIVCVESSPDLYQILRWGIAPEDQIALQAGDGEVAFEAPASWDFPTGSTPAGYYYTPSTGTVFAIVAPPPLPDLQDNLDYYLPRIREALRATDWAMLPDADLTPGEVAEMVTYRDNLRAQVALITDGFPSISIPAPPYEEL
ncbi:hypothetical protein [Szabonella alba]|uniref:Uncharacterized protein n=1 Tax=Szabonella alba TaxID=2804194 RepID=A0A8K0VFB8_9RHOB|nr:hypothetical protein [Szabonella alba]MBL4917995.1 hypothetical protein [Szabonella alba]